MKESLSVDHGPIDKSGMMEGEVPGKNGYFPLQWYRDLMEFIAQDETLEVITYKDLPWGEDFNFKNGYNDEYKRWLESRNPEKIYILLQHDVDRRPHQTDNMMIAESEHLLCSNVMLFNQLVDRRHLKNTGELRYCDYPVDKSLWKRFEQKGFVFGYHSNAMEQAGYDQELAAKIFDNDILELKQSFRIDFFSAHGGVAGPDGTNNHSMIFPQNYRQKIRWVHNGFSPRFSGTYSDGGLNNPKRDPETKNLAKFFLKMKRGKRYRILIHPQYFSDSFNINERLNTAQWYQDVLKYYQGDEKKRNFWKQLVFPWQPVEPVGLWQGWRSFFNKRRMRTGDE